LLFLAAFCLDRREVSAFHLSLLALFAAGQFIAEAARGVTPYLYPVHAFRLIAISAFACLFSVTLCAFVASRFHIAKARLWIAVAVAIAFSTALFARGFELKTLLPLLAGGAVALAMLWPAVRAGEAGSRLTAGALVGFMVLILIRTDTFIYRDFY